MANWWEAAPLVNEARPDPHIIGWMLGALIITFPMSRFALWAMGARDGDLRKIVSAHIICLLFSSLVAGMGMADGGAFAGLEALGIYVIPQAFWLAIDIYRTKIKRTQTIEEQIESKIQSKYLKNSHINWKQLLKILLLWISGLSASALILGSAFDSPLGVFSGISAFICARLWATEKR